MNLVHNGFDFVEFIKTDDQHCFSKVQPIRGSYIVIKVKDKYLMCFNKWRKQWELPAGKREMGESPLDCAIRELYEETGQTATNLKLLGLLKSKNKEGHEKYNPVFVGQLDELQPFIENEEISAITLWDLQTDIGLIDELDFHIFEFLG